MLIPLSFDEKCYMIVDNLIWQYASTEFCRIVEFIQDFLYGVGIVGFIIMIDLLTTCVLFKIYFLKKYKKIVKKKNARQAKEFRSDINIFIRTVIANTFLVLNIICFNVVSRMVNHNENLEFLAKTFFWMLHPLIDAVIVGLLNSDVKRHILKKLKLSKNSISAAELVTNNQKLHQRTVNQQHLVL